jgi:hypothetical protein
VSLILCFLWHHISRIHIFTSAYCTQTWHVHNMELDTNASTSCTYSIGRKVIRGECWYPLKFASESRWNTTTWRGNDEWRVVWPCIVDIPSGTQPPLIFRTSAHNKAPLTQLSSNISYKSKNEWSRKHMNLGGMGHPTDTGGSFLEAKRALHVSTWCQRLRKTGAIPPLLCASSLASSLGKWRTLLPFGGNIWQSLSTA